MAAAAGFGVLWFALGPRAAMVVVAVAVVAVVPAALATAARLDRTAAGRGLGA
jgi:hypothetical protein